MGLTVQQLLQEHLPRLVRNRRLSKDMWRAAAQLRDCRTAALGGHVNSCPHGHFDQIAYNSCHHRCCPLCSGLARARWLEGWKQRLLPCPHHHIVFTTPHELLPLWRFNKSEFASTLFAAASQTLRELLDDPKYLGARVGLLAALHTWSQTLAGHVHLHVLVTAGGLDAQGRWRQPKKMCLLPRKVLMIKFRGKLRAMLLERLSKGELKVPPRITTAQLRGLLNRLGRTIWNVKLLDRYEHGRGVATYLAHYLKGGPIGNQRLVAERDEHVLLRCRKRATAGRPGQGQRIVRLPSTEFLRRYLEHVPERGFQTVRGYGLYCGNQHSRLPEAHEALGSQPPDPESEPLSWQEYCAAAGDTGAGKCPKCGATLISHSHFQYGREPPLAKLDSAKAKAGAA